MAYAGYLIRVGNYTIPKKYIRAEKYDAELHGQDLDSYRDANGQLQRTALQHTVVDVTFSAPPMMHEATWRNLIDNIRAQYTNSIEKKCTAFYLCNKDFSSAKEYSEEDWSETEFEAEYSDENTTYLDLIKLVCQLNCVWGRINRYGKFTFIFPTQLTEDDSFYPGAESYLPMYPTTGTDSASNSAHYAHYKEVTYETYKIKPLNRFIVCDSSKDKAKGNVGTGKRKYIVQGNQLLFGLDRMWKTQLATLLMVQNEGFTYQPFEATTMGLPYIECRDVAMFYVYDYINSAQQQKDIWVEMSFIILHRKLTGIQQLIQDVSV